MMALFFCNRAHPVHEIQGLLEVGESECTGEVVLVNNIPIFLSRELVIDRFEFCSGKRRDAAATRYTRFFRQ